MDGDTDGDVVYDAQRRLLVPIAKAVKYMTASWLCDWGCPQTVLSLLTLASRLIKERDSKKKD